MMEILSKGGILLIPIDQLCRKIKQMINNETNRLVAVRMMNIAKAAELYFQDACSVKDRYPV